MLSGMGQGSSLPCVQLHRPARNLGGIHCGDNRKLLLAATADWTASYRATRRPLNKGNEIFIDCTLSV